MIGSFRCADTRRLHLGERVKRFEFIRKQVLRKLDMIDAAAQVGDLRAPPGNRLEALSGDRAGQYSIRVNDQWRICFRWDEGAAWDVELVDYH